MFLEVHLARNTKSQNKKKQKVKKWGRGRGSDEVEGKADGYKERRNTTWIHSISSFLTGYEKPQAFVCA